MGALISRITQFITTDIWAVRLVDLPARRAALFRNGRIILIAVREFRSNRCTLRASALTFFSLLAVVPVFAMLFGIAKGFGFQKRLETQLLENFPEHETVVRQVIQFSANLLENTEGGLVAGIGVVILFWTIIRILGQIELALNDIWKVTRPRSLIRKVTDYLSIMLIWPVNFVLSASATAFVAGWLTEVTSDDRVLRAVGPFVSFLLILLPYILTWFFLTFIYMAMPNTRVRFVPAFVGAVVAGTAYQIVQALFISFQIGVADSNAIYGSFAALPLFLIWLQMGWMIVLFGSELSYAVQNVDRYASVMEVSELSFHSKKLSSLAIVHLIVKRFARGEPPATASVVSRSLVMSAALARALLKELVQSGLLSTTESADRRDTAYQPAGDIARYTVGYVVTALERRGGDAVPVASTPELGILSEAVEHMGEGFAESSWNKLLKDI